MKGRRKSFAARPLKKGRHADSKINRAVSMKTAIDESKRYNIATLREAENSQSEKRS